MEGSSWGLPLDLVGIIRKVKGAVAPRVAAAAVAVSSVKTCAPIVKQIHKG